MAEIYYFVLFTRNEQQICNFRSLERQVTKKSKKFESFSKPWDLILSSRNYN